MGEFAEQPASQIDWDATLRPARRGAPLRAAAAEGPLLPCRGGCGIQLRAKFRGRNGWLPRICGSCYDAQQEGIEAGRERPRSGPPPVPYNEFPPGY